MHFHLYIIINDFILITSTFNSIYMYIYCNYKNYMTNEIPFNSVVEICKSTEPYFETARKQFQELSAKIPENQYYRYGGSKFLNISEYFFFLSFITTNIIISNYMAHDSLNIFVCSDSMITGSMLFKNYLFCRH